MNIGKTGRFSPFRLAFFNKNPVFQKKNGFFEQDFRKKEKCYLKKQKNVIHFINVLKSLKTKNRENDHGKPEKKAPPENCPAQAQKNPEGLASQE